MEGGLQGAAQVRAHEVLHPLHADRLDSSDLLEGHTPQVVVVQGKVRCSGDTRQDTICECKYHLFQIYGEQLRR